MAVKGVGQAFVVFSTVGAGILMKFANANEKP